jgi:hypothetical protein
MHYAKRSINCKRAKRIYLCDHCASIIDVKYFVQRGQRYNLMLYKLRKKKPSLCILYDNLDKPYKLRKELFDKGVVAI